MLLLSKKHNNTLNSTLRRLNMTLHPSHFLGREIKQLVSQNMMNVGLLHHHKKLDICLVVKGIPLPSWIFCSRITKTWHALLLKGSE